MFDGNAMRYIGPEVVEATIKVLGSWMSFLVCSNFDRTTVILKDFTLYRCFCFVHWKTLLFQFFKQCHERDMTEFQPKRALSNSNPNG